MTPKEIVIISGKGGTGKTTITASFAFWLASKGVKFVVADADVDAADMHILLKPEVEKEEEFEGRAVAVIDNDLCTGCDICRQLCRFDAITVEEGEYKVIEGRCEGCTLCEIACPVNAIKMVPQKVGRWFISRTPYGPMVHARLNPGGENSGNLVTMVKYQAKRIAEEKGYPVVLVDGPPGIGCPVISALSGASFALVVTEPTFSAIHDAERVLKTAAHFHVPSAIVVNKADINPENTEKIKKYASENSILFLGEIPFDRCAVEALMERKTPMESCPSLSRVMEKIFEKVMEASSGATR